MYGHRVMSLTPCLKYIDMNAYHTLTETRLLSSNSVSMPIQYTLLRTLPVHIMLRRLALATPSS